MFAVANYYATCKKILANSFAKIYVRRERPLEVGRFLPANEFSGEPFASSRRSARELGRTRANSAELRRTFGVLRRTSGGVRRTVGVGEPLASSRGNFKYGPGQIPLFLSLISERKLESRNIFEIRVYHHGCQ